MWVNGRSLGPVDLRLVKGEPVKERESFISHQSFILSFVPSQPY